MAQKLRIPIETLRAKVEDLAKKAAEKLKADKAQFEIDRKAHRKLVVSALRHEALRIDKGGKYDTRYYGGDYDLRVKVAAPPTPPTADTRLTSDLATLRATDQEHVLVDPTDRQDHWARYIR